MLPYDGSLERLLKGLFADDEEEEISVIKLPLPIPIPLGYCCRMSYAAYNGNG